MTQAPATPTVQAVIRPFVAVPTYDGCVKFQTYEALEALDARLPNRIRSTRSISLLPFCMNLLYAEALNCRKTHGVTHFFMVHADVAPTPKDWPLRMLSAMAQHKLSALAAVIAIKNNERQTSTARDLPGSGPHDEPQRYAIGEIDGVLTSREAPGLLINTGLLCIDLSDPNAEKLYFRFRDAIVRDKEGNYRPWTAPEDWELSRQMRKLGMAYGAIGSFEVKHYGGGVFGNQAVPEGERSPSTSIK